MLDIEYSRLTNIDLGGGRTEEGGGFIGGGFGLEGFAIGAGVASLLNALTTRSSVATVIGFQWPEGELIALSRDATPDDLRIRLSRVFGLLRQRERDQTARQPDPVDQIERLGDLKERGLLTEEEFDAAKRALLAKLT